MCTDILKRTETSDPDYIQLEAAIRSLEEVMMSVLLFFNIHVFLPSFIAICVLIVYALKWDDSLCAVKD